MTRYEYRTHTFWNHAEEITALSMYEDGVSTQKIATHLNRTVESVRLKLHRLGARVQKHPSEYEATELAQLLGITLPALHQHFLRGMPSVLRANRRYITKSEFHNWLMDGHAFSVDINRITDEHMQRLVEECRGSWIVSRQGVAKMFRVCNNTITIWIHKRHDFPKPRRLRGNTHVWMRDELIAWAIKVGKQIHA